MTNVIHNFRIETPDGDYDMAHSFGVLVSSFVPSEPEVSYTTHDIAGRNGVLLTDAHYGVRTIEASCSMYASNPDELARRLRELGALCRKYRTFNLLPESTPGMRWVVSSGGPAGVQQAGSFATFSLTFTAWQPFAESVQAQDESMTATSSFTIRNDGDVAVDPRALPLEIIYNGASTNLRIHNTTTGDDWRYTGTSNEGDTIKLDGVRSTKNSLSIVRDTNLELITLAPGDNEFTLYGTSGLPTVQFKYRNYYL
jgi:phage-related protein